MNKRANKQTSKQGDKDGANKEITWNAFPAWDATSPGFIQQRLHFFIPPTRLRVSQSESALSTAYHLHLFTPDSTVLQTVSWVITLINKPIMWNKNTVASHLKAHRLSHELFLLRLLLLLSLSIFLASFAAPPISPSLLDELMTEWFLRMHYAW